VLPTQALRHPKGRLATFCGTLALACATPSGADASPESFQIAEFRVLGSSAVPPVEIERAVYPMLGPDRTIRDVERARDALVDLYKTRGFGAVAIDIPEQEVADGVVRLQITEGRLGEVRITGARYFSNGAIRTAMPSLQPGEVLHLPSLQRDLAHVNRQTADRSVTPVLRSGRATGTVDLELKVSDDFPLIAQVETNDRYTADTSRTRLSATIGYANLFQKFHTFTLQYQTAPEEPSEARVLAGTYLAPIGTQGRVLALYAVNTDSDVSTIGSLSVIGAGNIYGSRLILPIDRPGAIAHGFTLGADYKDFEDRVELEDGADETPISYLNWSIGYTANVMVDGSSTALNAVGNFGLRGVVNDSDEFAYKRFGARANYLYFRGGARHERTVPFGGRLMFRLDGQVTDAPLISNEQFSIGGVDSVRGYLEAEALGDVGLSATFGWRTASLNAPLGAWAQDAYLLAFADAGVVHVIEALPGQDSKIDLSSAGLGLRLQAFDGFQTALDVAYPFVAGPYTGSGDTRLHFMVRYDF
jgi:hemolysin activation/secretion protein